MLTLPRWLGTGVLQCPVQRKKSLLEMIPPKAFTITDTFRDTTGPCCRYLAQVSGTNGTHLCDAKRRQGTLFCPANKSVLALFSPLETFQSHCVRTAPLETSDNTLPEQNCKFQRGFFEPGWVILLSLLQAVWGGYKKNTHSH